MSNLKDFYNNGGSYQPQITENRTDIDINTAELADKGKTVLYSGVVVGDGGDVPLSDDIANYDAIRIYGRWSTGGDSFGNNITLETEEVLNPTIRFFAVSEFWSNSNTSIAVIRIDNSSSTNTSLRCSAYSEGYTAEGIYKVVGIRY